MSSEKLRIVWQMWQVTKALIQLVSQSIMLLDDWLEYRDTH